MAIHRPPHPRLAPFVRSVWASDRAPDRPGGVEHVLPSGSMHLVFRLGGTGLRLLDAGGGAGGCVLGWAVVGGPRSSFYAKDASCSPGSVGAQLRPGACRPLFGVDADALAERHTPLEALWGAEAGLALERIHAATGPAAQLAVLERLLAARLPLLRGLHPAVAQALHALGEAGGVPIAELARASGYSHRRFGALFRQQVGLGPKTFARVLRWQTVLARAQSLARAGQPLSWSALALDAGYSDQAHLGREFRALAGVTPEAYRLARPRAVHHLPLGAGRAS